MNQKIECKKCNCEIPIHKLNQYEGQSPYGIVMFPVFTESTDNIEQRVIKILRACGPEPITRDKIEWYLTRESIAHGEYELPYTMDIRDGIHNLARQGIIEEGFARSIKLVK